MLKIILRLQYLYLQKFRNESTLANSLNLHTIRKEYTILNASNDKSIDYERNFNFKLTDKKATSNLLKSANGQQFEVETKQMSKLLKFSPGTYLQVAKPLLNQYIKIHENKTTILENGLEIIVHDLREGQELNNKNVDTKIELSVNKQKVIMHCYNTTQNILVNGIGYLNFSENFWSLCSNSKLQN